MQLQRPATALGTLCPTQQQPQQEEDTRQKTSTLPSSSTDETFDAMRTAAVSMFKQRTNDLTKLSTLQSQSVELEKEVGTLQSTIAQLHTLHADLDALFEQEEQRAREREAQLTQMHTALVQLDEEQRGFAKVEKSTVKVTVTMKRMLDRFAGCDARLSILLDQAQNTVAGRSANDFRGLASEVRRRTTLLRDRVQGIRKAAPAVASCTSVGTGRELHQLLQEWVGGSWGKHKELAEVLRIMREVLRVFQSERTGVRPNDDTNLNCMPDFLSDNAFSDPALAVERLFGAATALVGAENAAERMADAGGSTADNAACLARFTGPCGETEPDPNAVQTPVPSENLTAAVVAVYTSELDALQGCIDRVHQLSDGTGVCCDVLESGVPLQRLRDGWAAFVAMYAQWEAMSSVSRSEGGTLCMLQDRLKASTSVLQEHANRLTTMQCHCDDTEAAIQLLEAELQKYEEAWNSACCAAAAQWTALQQLLACNTETHQQVQAVSSAVETSRANMAVDAEAHRAALQQLVEEQDALERMVKQDGETQETIEVQCERDTAMLQHLQQGIASASLALLQREENCHHHDDQLGGFQSDEEAFATTQGPQEWPSLVDALHRLREDVTAAAPQSEDDTDAVSSLFPELIAAGDFHWSSEDQLRFRDALLQWRSQQHSVLGVTSRGEHEEQATDADGGLRGVLQEALGESAGWLSSVPSELLQQLAQLVLEEEDAFQEERRRHEESLASIVEETNLIRKELCESSQGCFMGAAPATAVTLA